MATNEKKGDKKEPKRQVRIATEVQVNDTCLVNVDVDVDEVLRELDEDDLQAALQRRNVTLSQVNRPVTKLTLIYEEFARRGDAPQVLKDFIYETIGRIL